MDGVIAARSQCRRALVVYNANGVFVCASTAFTPSFELVIQRYWMNVDALAWELINSLDIGELRDLLRVVPGESASATNLQEDQFSALQRRVFTRLMEGHIKVYRFDKTEYAKIQHPHQTLLTDMRKIGLHDAWQSPNASLTEIRQAIAYELTRSLVERALTKDTWDQVLREESLAARLGIYTGAALTGVGDWVKQLGDTAIFLIEVAKTIEEARNAALRVTFQLSKELLQGNIDKVEQLVREMGGKLERGAAEAGQLIEEAARVLQILLNDPSIGTMLSQYLWAYADATPRTEKVRSALPVGVDALISLGLAVVTLPGGGAGGAAYAARTFGAFSGRLIQLLARAFRAMSKAASSAAEKLPAVRRIERAVSDATDGKGPAGTSKNTPESKAGADNNQTGANKNGEPTPANPRTGGEPISLVTGEEILALTDFTLPGVLPLAWERVYKSSNPDDSGLGHGWTHSFDERLVVGADTIQYHTAEARIVTFNRPSIGDEAINRAEKLRLHCIADDQFIVTDSQHLSPQRIFAARHGDSLRLSAVRDTAGNGVTLAYDHDRLQTLTASLGTVWSLTYNASGHIDGVHKHLGGDARRTLVQYRYDDAGDLISAIDGSGHAEHYAYRHHLIARRTLKSGYSFHFQWDGETSKARCVRNWGDAINGQPTYDYRFVWDRANRSVAVTDTRGGTEHYRFNAQGLPVYHRDQEGGETHYQYDADGNLLRQTDPLGNTQRFGYDRHGRIHQITDVEGAQTRFHRDAHGNITETLDPLGQRWQRRYNEQGQLLEQTNPLGETTRYQYNPLGLISAITNPLGESWHYLWDHQGQLTAIRNPLGQHTRYNHNDDGQLTAIVWPDGNRTEYDYDASGRCTVIKTPDGKTQQYEYNPLGLLSQQRDSSGRVTEYHYNGLSQVVKRVDPLGQTLHYHYDGERNLIGLTNENGERYSLSYDRCERLIEEIGFDGRVQRYQYNAAGHLTVAETLAPDGQTVRSRLRYSRNRRGQLLAQWADTDSACANPPHTSKAADLLAELHYDKAGRLIQADNARRSLQWRYDVAGRLIEDHQDHHILRHHYNAAGRRIGSVLPGGEAIDYRFDGAGAFTGLTYNGTDVAAITRDALGREIERQHGNQLITEHSYDPQGRLQRQALYDRSTSQSIGLRPLLNTRSYHYNAQGQLSQIDDDRRGSTHYQYDPLDRLLQVQGPNPETFVHDPAGNLLGTDEAAARNTRIEGNRLLFQGDTHYAYDEHGNRIEQRRGKDGKLVTRFEYDALNQLVAIDNNGARTDYAYDALGRRIRKQSEQSTTEFLWNGDVLLSETPEQSDEKLGATTKTYLFEPGTFKPLAFVQNKQLYHYHLDHLGTPQEITDARGKIVWGVSYRAYGSVALAHEQSVENHLRFQGQYYDEESGLHYNRFRYYDPAVGRFINQDPIGLLGGTNNYWYVPNPISWIDPYGLTCKEGGAPKDLQEIRRGYVEEIYQIEHANNAMREAGYDWEAIARRAHQTRREVGEKYKHLTPFGQRMGIYLRNIAPKSWTFLNEPILFGKSILPPNLKPQGYDSILGPSVDWLRNVKGKSWEEIAKSAADPNVKVTRGLGIEPNDVRKSMGLPPLEE